ncbi:MAG: transposase [Myxococcales bacterium]|nr:MAG: transposase [Myxococcales bacterium]
MPRPLRRLLPEEAYFVTNRTFEQRFFFKPSNKVNEIIGRCLAKAIATYEIQLFAFVFMANHFHFVLRAPLGNLSDFMACFQSMLARDINRHLGRNGPMFQRRYSAIPILDEGAFIERMVYTLNNPVKAGLVNQAGQHTGLSSFPETFQNKSRSFCWMDRSRWWQAGCPKKSKAFEKRVPLRITPLAKPWRMMLEQELKSDALRLKQERQASGKALLRSAKAKRIKTTDRPKSSKRSPQPRCHSTEPKLRAAFDEVWHRFVQTFREGAMCVAQGNWLDAVFPPGSFPPTRYPVRFDGCESITATLCF